MCESAVNMRVSAVNMRDLIARVLGTVAVVSFGIGGYILRGFGGIYRFVWTSGRFFNDSCGFSEVYTCDHADYKPSKFLLHLCTLLS